MSSTQGRVESAAPLNSAPPSSGSGRLVQTGFKVLTVLAVFFILSAIAMNTVLAIRQAGEQRRTLATIQASSAVKRALDDFQQALLDEHADLYMLVGTKSFYKRAPYAFPLDQLQASSAGAREGCVSRDSCLSRLAELDVMTRTLARLSTDLSVSAAKQGGAVQLNDPALVGIDAYFYSLLAKVIEIRIDADKSIDMLVSRTSLDSQRTSNILLGSGLSAGIMLLALLLRNAHITRRLRRAWQIANRARTDLFHSKQTLEYVLDHIPQGIAWKDSELRYRGGNEVYARDAGLDSRHQLVGLTDSDLNWADDPEAARAEDIAIMNGTLLKKHVERQAVSRTGTSVWVSETKLPLRERSGAVAGVLIAYENITARKQSDLELRLQTRALDASTNAIFITAPHENSHVIHYVNAAFERMTGYARQEVVGADWEKLYSLANEEGTWTLIRDALNEGTEQNSTIRCVRKDGTNFWNNVMVAPVRSPEGHVGHHVGIMSDVSAIVEYQAELQRQASYDSLTGLPNRATLELRLEEAIVRSKVSGEEVAVLFLDLDRFKQVNDSLGHRVGDELLTHMARRLSIAIRATDIVARYGGDEFVIIAERSSAARLIPMLNRIVASMTEPFRLAGHELYVEVSIGISTFPQDGPDTDTLLRNADAAMYLAKENGRNGYQHYRPELNRTAADRLKLSNKLRRAVKVNALRVVYQPQFDMVTGRLCGAEALVRWTDEEFGAVPPTVFIPIAEETGAILKLGEWVLRTACLQAKAWIDVGEDSTPVSVNVSPVQLERSEFVELVREVLKQTRLPAHMLELEVTEGALMGNPDEVARVLRELRGLGVKIAIDDFGTGYSSLSYLKRFSIDRIKIDRAFVQEIGKDSEYEALALAIIAMAGALRFEVIAEGVETDEHRRFLIEHGCVEGQGYLFSQPVAASDFMQIIVKQGAPDIGQSWPWLS